MPRVNLMPPEIAAAERFRRLQLAMGSAVVVAAVAVGGLYLHARSGISSAQTQVNSAQAQNSTLTTKLNGLASVKQTFANVQAKQQLLQQAMGGEIRWSYVLNDLSLRIPSNVWLTAMQASETVPGIGLGAASTTTALPGSPTSSIGTISFSGLGFKHDDVATWLNAMAKERGFSQPIFTGSSETAIGSTGVVDFGSTVTITSKALSGRYIQKAGS
jgi:Tfp pilus assembly protein PilN